MEFPTNIKYTNEHEWIRLEGDTAYVGITDYAQQQLGDIVFIDVTTEGETLDKGSSPSEARFWKSTHSWKNTRNW